MSKAENILGDRPIVWAIRLGLFIVLLIALKGMSALSPLIPAPGALFAAFRDLFRQKDFYKDFGVTLYEAFAGLFLATLVGCAGGVAAGANRTATEFLNPILLALYSIPKIIFLPILLIAIGPGLGAKIANATIHAFFPIILNVMTGMRQIPSVQSAVARSMLATRTQTVMKVYLPNLLRPVLTGVRLGTGLAFLGTLLAELFESKVGIGHLINKLYSRGHIAEMLATIIVMFAVILVLNLLIKMLEASAPGCKTR